MANHLFGYFKPHEYGLVILPMTVVKRFHDCLLPTHQKVLDTYEKVKKLAVTDGFLRTASGYQFYNTSKFTFERPLADPENIESNFRDYLNGFSSNVQDVLAKFDFDTIIKRMVECGSLYLIIKEFASEKGYLGPDKISAVDCGYIFEDLVRRFSESFGEEAGAHFTIRRQKSRWGSCSNKGNLNFNCLLMLTPPEAIDSVVVHDLCHRKEINHSDKFYAEVLRVFPMYWEQDKWLKENGDILMTMLGE